MMAVQFTLMLIPDSFPPSNMNELKFTETKKHLSCSDDSLSGNYTIFEYEDEPEYLTAYNEDVKKEFYLKTDYFNKQFLKLHEQIQQLEPMLYQQNS